MAAAVPEPAEASLDPVAVPMAMASYGMASLRVRLDGITTSAPMAAIAARKPLLQSALSVSTAWPVGPSSSVGAWVMSPILSGSDDEA